MRTEEDHRDTMASDERDAELASSSIDRDPPTRRDFLLKSAEVAALSLFGVAAFDAVVEKVLSRAAEIEMLEGIAGSAISNLEESGVIGIAHALECRPEDDHTCKAAQKFGCNAESEVPFGECGQTSYEFHCEWGQDEFYCQFAEDAFDCDTEYSCPPVVEGFHCTSSSGFNCTYRDGFTCGGSADGYLCADSNRFLQGCSGGGTWDCDADDVFEWCYDYACPRTTPKFVCPEEGGFGCGIQAGKDGFECGGANQDFVCGGQTTIYDFKCVLGDDFQCGESDDGLFVCDANHQFFCQGGTDFRCAGKGEGNGFLCSAGGNKCNEGGSTGTYGFDTPGDFACAGVGTYFHCDHDFTCSASDDFICGEGDADFNCVAPFAGCQPHGSGSFVCDQGPPFYCQTSKDFECTQSMNFSETMN